MGTRRGWVTPGAFIGTGLLAGFIGAGLWGLRLAMQGGLQVWTDTARRAYLDDPDLGLVPTEATWIWLGLDGLLLTLALLAALAVGAWLQRRNRARREAGERPGLLLRLIPAAATLGVLPLLLSAVPPFLAIAGGLPPEGAALAIAQDADTEDVGGGEVVSLPVPGGVWKSVAERGLVVASVTAGGDTFEARFAGPSGTLRLDAADLARSEVSLAVAAGTVDTGIDLRSKHARDELKAEAHPEIRLKTSSLRLTQAAGGPIRWQGEVLVTLAGKETPAPARGEIRILGPAGRAKLGLPGDFALVVEARVELTIANLALDPANFSAPTLPITARAIFTP
jgi:polyisoprenoid-binding protein YceI